MKDEAMSSNYDEATEKVLTGLGSIEPTQGMNDRILRALAAEPVRIRRGVFGGYVAYGVITTILLGVTLLMHNTRRAPVEPVRGMSFATSARVTTPVVVATSRVAVQRMRHPALVARRSHEDVLDTLALREMNAPSLPAPPLPLTVEEKLLVSVARRGNPEEYAPLNPDLLARNEAMRRAQFPHIFTDDTPND